MGGAKTSLVGPEEVRQEVYTGYIQRPLIK